MSISDIKSKIDNKIWLKIRDYFYKQRIAEIPVIQNIGNNCDAEQKKALICYMTMGYSVNLESNNTGRTQPHEILKIVNILTGFGFSVDIIRCIDLRAVDIVKNKKYNLIFGFGETFYQLTNLQPEAVSVFYLTERHPDFSYQEEKKRLDYFFERHGRRLNITRSGKFYKKYHLDKVYSHIIAIGDVRLFRNANSIPYFLFPTGLINKRFIFKDKDHKKSRKNFLWLGSTGAIHKGLDLLLDVFYSREDLVLHICGLQKEERKALRMKVHKNIIEYGHININSDLFLELTNECSFIILPSCSEGFSTSIATGMLHGLIPVVNKDTGHNVLGDNAIFLEDFKTEYIEKKLNELSNTDPDKLALLSKQVYAYANGNFRLEIFEENFKRILGEILKVN
jgi:glycosyltransferase involved in cell wall biosynthesis